MEREFQMVAASALEVNAGQVEDLPKNPRLIRDARYESLKRSLGDSPEFMELRPLIAVSRGEGRPAVVICGNMRLRACLDLGWKEGAGHYFTNDRSQDTVMVEDDVDVEKMKKPDLVAYVKRMWEMYGERTDVLNENKPLRSDLHPTMKPVRLIGRLISNSSKEGWSVLDTFGGSGTTLIAAEQLHRRCFMMGEAHGKQGGESPAVKFYNLDIGKK